MDHGKVVPWGFKVSGLRCAEEVFVFDVVSGSDGFDGDGMVCVYELLFLCARVRFGRSGMCWSCSGDGECACIGL